MNKILLLLIIPMVFMSCKKDFVADTIMGKWIDYSGNDYPRLIIRSNDTYELIITEGGVNTGKYRISNNVLILKIGVFDAKYNIKLTGSGVLDMWMDGASDNDVIPGGKMKFKRI